MEHRGQLTRAVSALLIAALSASTMATLPAAAKATTPPSAAAGNYLAKQLRGDSTVRATPGGPIQVGNTVQVALSLKAAGLRPTQVAQAAATLTSYVAGRRKAKKLSTLDVGTLAYLALLAHATGRNPTNLGGVDLVALIEAQQRGQADAEAGLFGFADPTFDGVFRQSLVLQALLASGDRSSSVTRGFAWLSAQQCPNGGFTSDAVGNPCDGLAANWEGPDSNSTALAIAALASAASSWPASGITVPSSAWSFLASAQSSSGGVAYFPGGDPDSNSTAQVVIAMTAAAATAASVGLQRSPGHTPAAALTAFQVGGSGSSRGYEYQPGFGADVMSTEQALLAASGRTLVLTP